MITRAHTSNCGMIEKMFPAFESEKLLTCLSSISFLAHTVTLLENL